MSVEPITLRGTELSGKAGTEVEAARPGKRGRRLRIFGRYAALSVLAGASPLEARSAVFGGGPFYSGGQGVMDTVRASGCVGVR